MVFGLGYDIHRLKDGRKLIMGGVLFDTEYGLDGHSDADVVLHAICDALLGAAALGDIGDHFPDTDAKNKDLSSEIITKAIFGIVKDNGYSVNNIDVNIIAERPKLGARKLEIKAKVAEMLDVTPGRVSIKAKTNEGLDSVGRGEAISAQVIVSLNENR